MLNQPTSHRTPGFRLCADDRVTACPFCGTSALGEGVLPKGITLNNNSHDYWIECSCGARMDGEKFMLSYDEDPSSDTTIDTHVRSARSALARWNRRPLQVTK